MATEGEQVRPATPPGYGRGAERWPSGEFGQNPVGVTRPGAQQRPAVTCGARKSGQGCGLRYYGTIMPCTAPKSAAASGRCGPVVYRSRTCVTRLRRRQQSTQIIGRRKTLIERARRFATAAAREQGTTVVLVTHDARVAAYADREVVVRYGRVSTLTGAQP